MFKEAFFITHNNCHYLSGASGQNNFTGLIPIAVAVIALGVSVYQGYLSREALKLASKSINDDRKSRQISNLPELSWAITVEVKIDGWIKTLSAIKNETIIASEKNDIELLKKVAGKALLNPSDVHINTFEYEKMPSALREILISGAQYYYNAMSPVVALWSKDQPNWSYARSIIERYDESLLALSELKNLISDIVPQVIMNTPASIREEDFLS
jgi:hypothetical protein